MRLPGFTAEVSLDGNGAAYMWASTHASSAVGATVLPQFFFCHGNVCCNEWGYCIHKGPVLM
jgi:hypothetical protein